MQITSRGRCCNVHIEFSAQSHISDLRLEVSLARGQNPNY